MNVNDDFVQNETVGSKFIQFFQGIFGDSQEKAKSAGSEQLKLG